MATNGTEATQAQNAGTADPAQNFQKYTGTLGGRQIVAEPQGDNRWLVTDQASNVSVEVRLSEQFGDKHLANDSYVKEALLRQGQGLPGGPSGDVRTFEAGLFGGKVTAEPISGANDADQRLWQVTVEKGDTKATTYVTKQGQFGYEDLTKDSPAKQALAEQLPGNSGSPQGNTANAEPNNADPSEGTAQAATTGDDGAVSRAYERFTESAGDGLGFNESPLEHNRLRGTLDDLSAGERQDFYQKAITEGNAEQLRELHELLQGATGGGTKFLSEFRDALTNHASANERVEFIETLPQQAIEDNNRLASTVGQVVMSLEGNPQRLAEAHQALTAHNEDNDALFNVLRQQTSRETDGRAPEVSHENLNEMVEMFSTNLDDSERLASVFEASTRVVSDSLSNGPNAAAAAHSTMIENIKLLAQNDTSGIVTELRSGSTSVPGGLQTMFDNAMEAERPQVIGAAVGLIRAQADAVVGEIMRAEDSASLEQAYEAGKEDIRNLEFVAERLNNVIQGEQAAEVRDAGTWSTIAATATFTAAPLVGVVTGAGTAAAAIAPLVAGGTSEVIQNEALGDVQSLAELKEQLYKDVFVPRNPEIQRRDPDGDPVTRELPTGEVVDGELVREEQALHQWLDPSAQADHARLAENYEGTDQHAEKVREVQSRLSDIQTMIRRALEI